ncbi:DNA repair protein RecN [bacterium]|nr:DNA repair protein RecN [bacterium]
MIKSISIKNYILIDELTLEFHDGFNVFTGETGAGKSIIIGAIDSALGAKTTKEVIKTGSDKAYIELNIGIDNRFDRRDFVKNYIEIENNEITISREITMTSSRFRINGIQVTQDFIKDIREKLLDIHTQHQSYNYIQPKNHIILLDNFALKPHRDNIKLFSEKYNQYIELQKKLEQAQNIVNTTQQQEEFLKFQINEIESANIEDVNELEILEKELDILANVEKLKELSYSSYWALYGDDGNIINALGSVKANISKLTAMDESVNTLEEDFVNAYETLKEVASQLRDYSDSKENDNERMDYINERISLLDKLKRKYGNTLEDVLKTYDKLSEELSAIECSQDDIIKYEKEIKEIKTELDELSQTISKARYELAEVLSQAVTNELEKLELPKARFKIDIQPCNMNEKGIDKVEFLMSANISEDLKPLAKTASGGEISRVMLAIKTVFAQADNTNTVIFDEIDTGISGKASQSVADAISNLAKTHQIILITHQPIIAAKAASHFYVKKLQTDKTEVKVYHLDGENRVKAIALLAAGEINDDSTSFAKNLLGV